MPIPSDTSAVNLILETLVFLAIVAAIFFPRPR